MTTITIQTNNTYAEKIYKKLKADKNLIKVSVRKKGAAKKKPSPVSDHSALAEFGLQSLARAYSKDEPDYSDVTVREPKSKYKKNEGRRHRKN